MAPNNLDEIAEMEEATVSEASADQVLPEGEEDISLPEELKDGTENMQMTEAEETQDAAEDAATEEEPKPAKRRSRRSSKKADADEAAEAKDEKAPSKRSRSTKSKAAKEPAAEEIEKPATKMDKAAAATGNRRDVLNDAKKRDAERNAAREMREARLAELAKIQAAMHRNRILYGEVSGIEVVSVVDSRVRREVGQVMLNVMYEKQFLIRIPFDEIFRKNPIDMKTVDLSTPEGAEDFTRRQRTFASRLLRSVIPFKVTNIAKHEMYEDEIAIAASRKAALQSLCHINFVSIKNAKPVINVGDVVDATILAVGTHNLMVNIGGVDLRVPVWNLTYRYVPDAKRMYVAGETVKLQIVDIEADDKEPDLYNLKVSGRMVERSASIQRRQFLPVRSLVRGVVTRVFEARPRRDANGKEIEPKDGANIMMDAWLPAYEMPALVNRFNPMLFENPKTGDEIEVYVTGHLDNGVITTSLHRVLPASSFQTTRF